MKIMTPIQLQIEPGKARQIYKTASPELKAIIEQSCGKEFFSGRITDRVKTYEDACFELGRQPMDEEAFSAFLRAQLIQQGFPKDRVVGRIAASIAEYKIEAITSALNEGWIADWANTSQRKNFPFFITRGSSGFAFGVARWYDSIAFAGYASRFCFKSEELARYAGQQFTDLYMAFIMC